MVVLGSLNNVSEDLKGSQGAPRSMALQGVSGVFQRVSGAFKEDFIGSQMGYIEFEGVLGYWRHFRKF